MSEKRSRDRAVFAALHGIAFDDELEAPEIPDFSAGARTDHQPYGEPTPRPGAYREPGGWWTVELEDGQWPYVRNVK